MNPENILIVDDDESTCRSLTLVLEKIGYETEIAMTGKEAIEKTRKKIFNVVLLDIKLPDTEGVELIKPFKKINPDTGIIIITAFASLETAMRSVNEGVSAYITKPINMDKLLHKIKTILRKQRLNVSNKKFIEKAKKDAYTGKINLEKFIKEKYRLDKNTPFKIKHAIKYIIKNYKKPHLSLTEVASAVQMHPNGFSRLWSKIMKTTIRNLVNTIKMEAAKTMLKETNLYVFQIAYELGLKPKRLARIFKSKIGMSPYEYRNSPVKKSSR